MLKVSHTAWPVGRMPKATNKIKESGLWYCKEGEELVKEAHRIVSNTKEARKAKIDQVAIVAKWFWVIFFTIAATSLIVFFFLNNHK